MWLAGAHAAALRRRHRRGNVREPVQLRHLPAHSRSDSPRRHTQGRRLKGTILTSNANLHARRQKAVPRGVSNSLEVYAERAANSEIWDVEGRRYIDFASGISVLNTGHVQPKDSEARDE